ncbi:MAG: universal stress protein [Alphaproteobacteria bacterium]|nr:universal stress protein [Alphaproteobacteria bacterium]
MITNILTYIDGRGSSENAAEAAMQLAVRHNAHVEGLHIRADPHDFITNAPVYSGIEAIEKFSDTFDREAAQIEERATGAFARVRHAHGVGEQKAGSKPTQPTAQWTVVSGSADTIVCQRARVADVCVVGRSGYGRDNSTTSVIESALFDSGRPVLIAPPHAPKSVGKDIVVAWNRSAAAASTLNSAMPLFDKAERICLVSVETGAKQGPPVEEAATYVERHGFTVDAKTLPLHNQGVGSTLLRYTHTHDSSLLVMGAYSHSRLREVILGGVTRHVLENATLPVLMVH